GLGDRLDNRTFELSAGQQQRVAVARALVTGPEVVLADEPIAEVDTENADLILDALADVSRRGGAVLAATHNAAALSYAGRVELLRPDFDLARERAARREAGVLWIVQERDLYPDVRPALERLRAEGYRIGISGNQPDGVTDSLRALHLPVDVVENSADWGVEKP